MNILSVIILIALIIFTIISTIFVMDLLDQYEITKKGDNVEEVKNFTRPDHIVTDNEVKLRFKINNSVVENE